jgi:hypothetical protein
VRVAALSGLPVGQEPAMLAACRRRGLIPKHRIGRDEWLVLVVG